MALDLNDKTTNGNTLTNVGAAEVTTSLPFAASTKAVDLELSESDYLWAADSASLSITGSLSLECWVKFESIAGAGGTHSLLTKYDDIGANKVSYNFFLTTNADPATNILRFIYSTDGSYQAANDKSVLWNPSTATWYHIAVTLDVSAKEIKFYVDGVQQGATQVPTGASIIDTDIKFAIGTYLQSNTTPVSFFDGVMDDVRVWNDVRTITEIANNKSVQLAGTEANLVAYWPFEPLPTAVSGSYAFFMS